VAAVVVLHYSLLANGKTVVEELKLKFHAAIQYDRGFYLTQCGQYCCSRFTVEIYALFVRLLLF
jgi:hypothetical protein